MSLSHGPGRLRRLHSKTKAKNGMSQFITGRSASFQSLQLVFEVSCDPSGFTPGEGAALKLAPATIRRHVPTHFWPLSILDSTTGKTQQTLLLMSSVRLLPYVCVICAPRRPGFQAWVRDRGRRPACPALGSH